MKFHQLAFGARFRYRDEVFRKTSPLMATGETDGAQCLIARSAEVRLLDESGAELVPDLPDRLPADRVTDAITGLLASTLRAVADLDPPLSESQQAQLHLGLERAREEILARLATPD